MNQMFYEFKSRLTERPILIDLTKISAYHEESFEENKTSLLVDGYWIYVEDPVEKVTQIIREAFKM